MQIMIVVAISMATTLMFYALCFWHAKNAFEAASALEASAIQQRNKQNLILAACFAYREQLNAEFDNINNPMADWDEFLFLSYELKQINELIAGL